MYEVITPKGGIPTHTLNVGQNTKMNEYRN